jgi:hypothetical protein
MKKKTSELPQPQTEAELASVAAAAAAAATAAAAASEGVVSPVRTLNRDQVPELMRTNSNKRIINPRPINHPTKNFRMKSLLWVKPTISRSQLSNSVTSQVRYCKKKKLDTPCNVQTAFV